MNNNSKSWLAGCGCGLGCALPTLLTVYGLGVLFAWFLWDEVGVRNDLFEPPLALIWPFFVGSLTALVLGVITLFVARAIARKKMDGGSDSPG